MPCVVQPDGGGGKMRVRYTACKKRGLVAALRRMMAEGVLLCAATSELCVSVANLSRWALQGVGKIDHLDKILRSKKKAALPGPVSQLKAMRVPCCTIIRVLQAGGIGKHLQSCIEGVISLRQVS